MKATDLKADLEAKISDLAAKIKGLEDEITQHKTEIGQLQVNLQRAAEDRKAENMEFQKTIADQTTTIEVLHKALDRLAKYYDNALFAQTGSRQTPPVPQ